MISQIAGTNSWVSSITGKTYSSEARARAAEAASKRMKDIWAERKIPLVDPDAPKTVFWEDIPASEKAYIGRGKRKHEEWFYANGYTDWPTEMFVRDYRVDFDATEIFDSVLKTSSKFKRFKLKYLEKINEWKLVKKTKAELEKEEIDTSDIGESTGKALVKTFNPEE